MNQTYAEFVLQQVAGADLGADDKLLVVAGTEVKQLSGITLPGYGLPTQVATLQAQLVQKNAEIAALQGRVLTLETALSQQGGFVGALTDIDPTTNRVLTDAAIGTPVGITARATGSNLVYSLDSNASGRFQINASTGVVTTAASLLTSAAGTPLTIIARATTPGGNYSTTQFSIAVALANRPIQLIDNTSQLQGVWPEDTPIGTVIGVAFAASDPDATDMVSYSLTEAGNGKFGINSVTGAITLLAPLDYGTATSHQITVQATSTDGTAASGTFVLQVLQVEAPTAPTNLRLPQLTGTALIGQLLTVDVGDWDHAPTSYAVQVKRNGSNIGGATGLTYTTTGADENATLTVSVIATNASGPSAAATSAGLGPILASSDFPVPSGTPSWAGALTAGAINTIVPITWSSGSTITERTRHVRVGSNLLTVPVSLGPVEVKVSKGWVESGATLGALDGDGFATIAKTSTAQNQYVAAPVAPTTAMTSAIFEIRAGSVATAHVGLNGANAWGGGSAALNYARIIRGPGSVTRFSGALFTLAGLSQSESTYIEIVRKTPNTTAVWFYPGAYSSTNSAHSIKVRRLTVQSVAESQAEGLEFYLAADGLISALTLTATQISAGILIEQSATNDAGKRTRKSDGSTVDVPASTGGPVGPTEPGAPVPPGQWQTVYAGGWLNVDAALAANDIHKVPVIYEQTFFRHGKAGGRVYRIENDPAMPPVQGYTDAAQSVANFPGSYIESDIEIWHLYPNVDVSQNLSAGHPAGVYYDSKPKWNPATPSVTAGRVHPDGQWHRANLKRYTECMRRLRQVSGRPVAPYGVCPSPDFYGYIPGHVNGAHMVEANNAYLEKHTITLIDGVTTESRSFLDEAYELHPTYYLRVRDFNAWKTSIRNSIAETLRICEAHRVSEGLAIRKQRVVPYMWPNWGFQADVGLAGTTPSSQLVGWKLIDGPTWREMLETIRSAGVDGFVIWGGYFGNDYAYTGSPSAPTARTTPAFGQQPWDENAPWWIETKDFLRDHGYA